MQLGAPQLHWPRVPRWCSAGRRGHLQLGSPLAGSPAGACSLEIARINFPVCRSWRELRLPGSTRASERGEPDF
jgi:hypothetical protein